MRLTRSGAVEVPLKLAIGIKKTAEKGEEGGKSGALRQVDIVQFPHTNPDAPPNWCTLAVQVC